MGRLEKCKRMIHCGGVLKSLVIESHPIGVIQHGSSPQRLNQLVKVVKIEGVSFDAAVEWIEAVG